MEGEEREPTRRRSPASRTRRRRSPPRVDPQDGAEILADRRLYSLAPLSTWKIDMLMDDPDSPEYLASWRRESNEEEEFVIFTLSLPDSSLYPLRIQIWQNNEVEYEIHAPMRLHIHPRKKRITIRMLASVMAAPEGVVVTYKP